MAGPTSSATPTFAASLDPSSGPAANRRYCRLALVKPEESAMPWHFCHMETPHKKLALPEWYVSSLMMDRALDAVVRRAKKIDRNHDIPYLAGYSNDGKTIYIDRHMPAVWKYRGREIDTDRYLIL